MTYANIFHEFLLKLYVIYNDFLDPKISFPVETAAVMVRLHTKNQLDTLPGNAWKGCVGGGGWVVVESKFSDRLWLSFSLALAKPNKIN